MLTLRRLALIGIMGLAAGCSSLPEPFVFRPREFDRTLPTFGQEPTDLTEVVVCYNSRNATPQAVNALAAESCGRYGKRAVFTHHRVLACPLLTPAAAHYNCAP